MSLRSESKIYYYTIYSSSVAKRREVLERSHFFGHIFNNNFSAFLDFSDICAFSNRRYNIMACLRIRYEIQLVDMNISKNVTFILHTFSFSNHFYRIRLHLSIFFFHTPRLIENENEYLFEIP